MRTGLLQVNETEQEAIEQIALEFIRAHARTTTDAAEVLTIAWQVYSYLFRDELLPVDGLDQVGPAELRILREAAMFMALNKVELDGSISNVGPCWFFPAATGVWARSGVERLKLAGGGTVVFKYAEAPFDREHIALQLAAGSGLPVPALLAAHTTPGLLGMLLEDLGEPVREASDQDGAKAAVAVHHVPVTAARSLPRLDAGALARLPDRIVARAGQLDLPSGIAAAAAAIGRRAGRLTEGAELPPFGFCHSEYHPSSLHVTRDGWRLLDLARAFTGPGLLDLASWPGTVTEPRPQATATLISAYITAGGPPEAAAPRGGLPAHIWALAWHRIWIADWYAEQIERGWAGNEMHTWTDAITRHLHEATTLLDS